MFRLIIPGIYLFRSRLRARWEKISWFLLHPALAGYIAYAFSNVSAGKAGVILCMGMLAWISMYEIGYIENDLGAARSGDRKGQRLSTADMEKIALHFRLILAGKWLMSALLVAGVNLTARAMRVHVATLQFAALLLAVRVLFMFHNALRSRLKILTFFSLYTLKYAALALLLAGRVTPTLLVAAVVAVPLPRVMEYSAKAKFGLQSWAVFVGNLDRFRVRYYAIAFLVSIAFLLGGGGGSPVFVVLTCGMLLFRGAALFTVARFNIRARA